MLSIPSCPYGRPFSPKTHVVRLACSIEADVVIAALPNTVSAAVHSPLNIRFCTSTPNLKHTILMDILRRGKYACVAGAKVVPPSAAKVKTDVTAQVMAAHVTLIIGGTIRHTMVIPQE